MSFHLESGVAPERLASSSAAPSSSADVASPSPSEEAPRAEPDDEAAVAIQRVVRGQQHRRRADDLYAASLHQKWIEYFLAQGKPNLARKVGWVPRDEVRAAVVMQARWRAVRARRQMGPALAAARAANQGANLWSMVLSGGWWK